MKMKLWLSMYFLLAVGCAPAASGLPARCPENKAEGGAPPERKPLHLELPTLSARHKALEALAGDWILKGKTYKGSPWGEGEFTGREHNEFMKGGMFLVSTTQYGGNFKDSSQIGFFGVDPKTGQYTFAMFNSLGVTVRVVGKLRDEASASLTGNSIAWGEPPGGSVAFGPGKDLNVDWGGDVIRYNTEIISNNEYRFSLERGGVRTYDGVATRVNAVN